MREMYVWCTKPVKAICTPGDMYSQVPSVHAVHMRRPKKQRQTYGLTAIRRRRKERRRTLEELAEALGITHASLSRIERGLQPYSQPILEGLSRELKVSVAALLGEEDPTGDLAPLWKDATPAERDKIVDIAKIIVTPDKE